MQRRKTKIVCSIGPSAFDDGVVRGLILAGMNVARLNFSHGTHDTHRASIERLRRLSGELGIPVAILLDTKGPEIRTGMVDDGDSEKNTTVSINKNDPVDVSVDNCLTSAAHGSTPAHISISWKEAPEKLQRGNHILIADGILDLEVIGVTGSIVNCRAVSSAAISSRKNVNLTGIHAQLPIIGEQDKKDISFGVAMNLDYIAASFVSFPQEIVEIKKYLKSLNSSIKVIAKIENGEGVGNIREIARLADGVMVARGDLGVQLPVEQIPLVQKDIISVCRMAGKPVITATQMLESMIVNPRPTRAELTDVANAIFDGTDAVMLSGETANGAYPVEAVQMMDKIARTTEQSEEFHIRMKTIRNECLSPEFYQHENLGVIMARSGVEIASSVNAKVIVTPTLSGNTARLLSAFKPDQNVLAVTPGERAIREMQLYWGVHPCYAPIADESESKIQNSIRLALEAGMAGLADKIVLVAGLPLQSPYMVNTVRVLIPGTVLAYSGSGGFANDRKKRVQGKIVYADTPEEAHDKKAMLNGGILVCRVLTGEFEGVIRMVKGVICEEVSELTGEQLRTINPDLVWLTHIGHTAEKLESGLTVTIDASELLVYEGLV